LDNPDLNMRQSYFDYDSRSIIDVSPNVLGSGYVLARVNTPARFRGKGIARQLMSQMLTDADQDKVDLWLDINPYGPMDYDQLAAWYIRCGFVLQPNGRFCRVPR
jgi:predicted GNAT family N-acyltransferase